MSVYFHGNFGLNRQYMAGILKGLLKNPNADPNELAKLYGYKAPFTNKYKSWLSKTGILDNNRGPKLTPFGKIIMAMDSNLESITTQWYMHHQLTSDSQIAESWRFFVKEFLPKVDSFSKMELEEKLGTKLMPHSPKHFSQGKPMNKVITRKLIECYVEDRALGALNIIYKNENGDYSKGIPRVIGPWKTPEDLMKAF